MAGGDEKHGSIFSLVWKIFMGFFLLFLLKLCIQYPEKRYLDVCFFPYKVEQVVMVDVFGAIFVDDQITLLKNSKRASNRYFRCLKATKKSSILSHMYFPYGIGVLICLIFLIRWANKRPSHS